MNPETRRRLLLGLGSVLLALGGAATVQFVLVRANVVSDVAEAYGVVVGVALALPLVLELVRPSDRVSTSGRTQAAVATSVAGAAAGAASVAAVLALDFGSPVTPVVGAGFTYVAGQVARSWLLGGAESGECEAPEEGFARENRQS